MILTKLENVKIFVAWQYKRKDAVRIASTTYIDVVNVFEATFQEKFQLNSDLVFQWFSMAVEEFSREIEPLVFDKDTDSFLYYDEDKNAILLPYLYIQILGYTIKRYYLIGKDLTLNNTNADKTHAKEELDYVNAKIAEFYDKLLPTAYNWGDFYEYRMVFNKFSSLYRRNRN